MVKTAALINNDCRLEFLVVDSKIRPGRLKGVVWYANLWGVYKEIQLILFYHSN